MSHRQHEGEPPSDPLWPVLLCLPLWLSPGRILFSIRTPTVWLAFLFLALSHWQSAHQESESLSFTARAPRVLQSLVSPFWCHRRTDAQSWQSCCMCPGTYRTSTTRRGFLMSCTQFWLVRLTVWAAEHIYRCLSPQNKPGSYVWNARHRILVISRFLPIVRDSAEETIVERFGLFFCRLGLTEVGVNTGRRCWFFVCFFF